MFRQEKKYYARAFLYALAMAAVLLAPFVLLDGGYFVYYGDYNAQQIPFYKTCIEAVQSGNLGWNWRTDLGANFEAPTASTRLEARSSGSRRCSRWRYRST